jgi:hypothetical protein
LKPSISGGRSMPFNQRTVGEACVIILSRSCPPGCDCGRHTAPKAMPCPPGCVCGKHTVAGYPCPPGCQCRRHEVRSCLPGCQCYRHHPNPLRGRLRRPDSTNYRTLHGRVRRARGRASAHQCSFCPSPARDWATVHGTDGTDPAEHYIPLCRSCHLTYDDDLRPTEALSEYAQNRARTPGGQFA